MDRHDLYELCVQNPPVLAAFLRHLHGKQPTRLAEDFCGTAALSREWVRGCAIDSDVRAICLDSDPSTIDVAKRRAASDPGIDAGRLEFIVSDAARAPLPRSFNEGSDTIFVGNFSIGELHDRSTLLRYLARARTRLRDGGIIACDTYGGESAWRTGAVRRTFRVASHMMQIFGVQSDFLAFIHYTWEQRSTDPFTARVTNALHFRVEVGGEIVQEFTDAFVYRWRVWSVPELRDAMEEAGFSETGYHTLLEPPAADPTGTHENQIQPEHFAACVVGRA